MTLIMMTVLTINIITFLRRKGGDEQTGPEGPSRGGEQAVTKPEDGRGGADTVTSRAAPHSCCYALACIGKHANKEKYVGKTRGLTWAAEGSISMFVTSGSLSFFFSANGMVITVILLVDRVDEQNRKKKYRK